MYYLVLCVLILVDVKCILVLMLCKALSDFCFKRLINVSYYLLKGGGKKGEKEEREEIMNNGLYQPNPILNPTKTLRRWTPLRG